MTQRELLRAHLPHTIPTLLTERSVIVVTPAVADTVWAVRAAWDLARAAARGGRRTALVDLSLEQPVLAAGASETTDEGIVDAFVFGASLTHVAKAQDVADLFFIGVGTLPMHPAEVWSHARWRRLARGFAQEGALLLLYAPPAALPALDVPSDGMIVLASGGFAPEAGAFPAIGQVLDRGVPLLGVVTERATVARVSRPSRLPRPRSLTPVLAGGIVLATAFVAGGFLLGRDDGRPAPAPNPAIVAPPAAPAAPAAIRPTPSLRFTPDSLFYSVQVAAFSTAGQATSAAYELEHEGWTAIVTPARLGGPAVWYRVLVGALPSAPAADSLLRRLRAARVLDPAQGAIQRTPLTYQVAAFTTDADASELVRGLRARGIPAYIVSGSDGTSRVLVGAFTEPAQAGAADSLLAAAGLDGHLVSRAGTPR